MCLVCDIFNKKIDLNIARRIDSGIGVRPIYDQLREYGISINEILNIFNEHDWNAGEIQKVTFDRLKALRKQYEKKQSIKEATDDFECD